MAHGTPLGTAENDERYGIRGALAIEVGISSAYHIAKFFGLTKRIPESQKIRGSAAKPSPPNSQPRRSRGTDVSAVIARALTAVGLKK
jgi:hypothetical protein